MSLFLRRTHFSDCLKQTVLRQRSKKHERCAAPAPVSQRKSQGQRSPEQLNTHSFSHTEVMTTVLKPRGLIIIIKIKINHQNKKMYLGRFPQHQKTEKNIEPFFLFSLSSLNTTPLTCCKKPCRDANSALLCPTRKITNTPFQTKTPGCKSQERNMLAKLC